MAKIIIEIPDEKVTEYKIGFLARCPVPLIIDNVTKQPIPEMTENEWVKVYIKRHLIAAYKEGKIIIAKNNAEFEDGIVNIDDILI